MSALIFILAIIIFIVADILIRMIHKKISDKRAFEERKAALEESLTLDFSQEAKTLKRVEVENPKARILAVDDEEVILDSFRKILVLDGYSVDTVESGKEALGLLQIHHYDFAFVDIKMPEMDGVEVCKSIKHLRPDIDVIIITGYASIESAVETMKYGAMDYVQKPFTEDELLAMIKKANIIRQDRIKKQLKPKVHISHATGFEEQSGDEFAIPGGVFISEGHCWVSVQQDGTVRIGIDDFAKKLIGKIDKIELPNLGMNAKRGQPLFTIKQGNRSIPLNAPVSGQVVKTNANLMEDLEVLDITPYQQNWICIIDAENLAAEIKELKIGKSAVSFYLEEIERCQNCIKELLASNSENGELPPRSNGLCLGDFEHLDDKNWQKTVRQFFYR